MMGTLAPGKFSDPRQNVKFFWLCEGMRVADFGSGSGHYALALSEAVGDTGKVYAVDIQQGLLKKLKNEAQARRKSNIEIVWGDLEAPKGSSLPDRSLDAVLISNLLFQVEKRGALFAEASRVLKSGGHLFIVDWKESFAGLGPRREDVVSEQKVKELATAQGFAVERSFDAGAHHYGLSFVKP